MTPKPDATLFDVPKQLVKVLDRDLAAAGIPKVDDRGRSLDVHALRHTFGSLLSAGGVAPRTAQAAVRHSSIDLTMNVYTDPRVLDVAGAMDALPMLPLDTAPHRTHQQATGTDAIDNRPGERPARTLTPVLTPKVGKRCKLGAIADNLDDGQPTRQNAKNPTKQAVSRGFQQYARRGSNPQPLVPKTTGLEFQAATVQEVTATPANAYPSAYPNSPDSMHGEGGAELSADDLRRLAAMAADGELGALIDAWGELPEGIRAGLLAMVRAVRG